MSDLTRRNVMKALAGGTVLATAAGNAAPAGPASDHVPTADEVPSTPRMGGTGAPRTSRVVLGMVSRCRSWECSIYLHVGPDLHGYVQVTPQAFAVAAACQAAGRPVAFRYWDHDPHWADGAGRFAGATLAVDRRDFEDAGDALAGLA